MTAAVRTCALRKVRDRGTAVPGIAEGLAPGPWPNGLEFSDTGLAIDCASGLIAAEPPPRYPANLTYPPACAL